MSTEPKVELDQIDSPTDDIEEAISGMPGATARNVVTDSSKLFESAELVECFIYDNNGAQIPIPNQPAGVFAAIAKETNLAVQMVMKKIDTSQIAALEIFEKGAEAFGADGDVARKLETDAKETIVKETVPVLLELLGEEGPLFLARIVGMIIEPKPERIRKNEALSYPADVVLWKFPVSELIQAVSYYIDSLSLGLLKKKVTEIRKA